LKDYQADRAIKIIDEYNDKKAEVRRKQMNISTLKKSPKEIKRCKKFDKKIRGRFYIWGDIKERYDIDKKYFIETNALVKYVPIDFSRSDEIRDNLNNIYRRQIVFDERVEFVGFRLIANIIFLSARYIIGIASLYSYDLFTALKLHEGLKEELENRFSPLPPSLIRVSEHLKVLVSREYYLIANVRYKIYKEFVFGNSLSSIHTPAIPRCSSFIISLRILLIFLYPVSTSSRICMLVASRIKSITSSICVQEASLLSRTPMEADKVKPLAHIPLNFATSTILALTPLCVPQINSSCGEISSLRYVLALFKVIRPQPPYTKIKLIIVIFV
jgi:hypothetical protein